MSKLNKQKQQFSRVLLAFMTLICLVFTGVVALVPESYVTALNSQADTLDVTAKFKDKMDSLGWINVTLKNGNYSSSSVNKSMWATVANESGKVTICVPCTTAETSETVEVQNNQLIAAMADDADLYEQDPTEETYLEDTTEESTQEESTEELSLIEDSTQEDYEVTSCEDLSDETFSDEESTETLEEETDESTETYTEISSEELTTEEQFITLPTDAKLYDEEVEETTTTTSLGKNIGENYTFTDIKVNYSDYVYGGYRTSTYYTSAANSTTKSVTVSIPNKLEDVASPDDSDLTLYYTIETDTALVDNITTSSAYRQYYVSTANQLAAIFYDYQYNIDSLKPTKEEYEKYPVSKQPPTSSINKVGIVLLNDIDLGGAENYKWWGYRNTSIVLDIDGQGHTIYNGYFANNYQFFLGTVNGGDRKFSIRNVTFSNMFIYHTGNIGGIFGNTVNYAYFENVNFENSVSTSTGKSYGSTIVIGSNYNYCYFKDCTINNCYVYGIGHSSMFASFNGNLTANRNRSYLGDESSFSYWYYTNIPSLEETERAWNGCTSLSEKYNEKKLTNFFPSIYENCAVVNSEVYDSGTHSGTFVSCIQSYVIFRNCFTNATIYGSTRTGVFIGDCIGSQDGFYYKVDGEREFVNSVFENCYSAGAVEGKYLIGGFVGVVFSDVEGYTRPTKSANRGKVVFLNCYSTSSVGTQYAGTMALGGFVGDVFENNQGTDSNLAVTNEQKHIFKNCYAAGEVGNILTCTDTTPTGSDTNKDTTNFTINDNNAVGGFMGTYYNDLEPVVENCYYDKQTTGMRERAIGAVVTRDGESVYSPTETTSKQLYNTLPEITGVYTKSSDDKSVAGLTDTVNMGDNNSWTYVPDYYPQLTNFSKSTADIKDTDNDLVQSMKNTRAKLYRNCSYASTAAVFLDHYDDILDKSGKEVDADATIYDTIRDITSKFEFTSTNSSSIKWAVDTVKNNERGFPNKLTGETGENGFKIDYTTSSSVTSETTTTTTTTAAIAAVDDDSDDSTTTTTAEVVDTYSKTFAPYVLTIKKVDGVYKCLDFAPGKQWVTVTVGSGETAGTRNLRLLPMAYLNAGDMISVKISSNSTRDDKTGKTTTEYTNQVIIDTSDGKQFITDTFNHSYGVAYAITERSRELSNSDGDGYKNQILASYEDAVKYEYDDYFALYGGFSINDSKKSSKINSDGEMFDQRFDGLTDSQNQSTDGKTMVVVYRAIPDSDVEETTETTTTTESDEVNLVGELKQGSKVDMTKNNNKDKWEGVASFEDSDTGYYYMYYYWRLNDGRYLSDNKLVYISKSSYNVEVVTGVLDEEQTINATSNADGLLCNIDQYVNPTGTNKSLSSFISYSTDDKINNLNSDNASDYYNNYTEGYEYNSPVEFSGDTYYVKSASISTSSWTTEVGWYRSSDYVMTTLIIEARDGDTGEWHQMAVVDGDSLNNKNKSFEFENTKYSYKFKAYKVTQNAETKLYTVKTLSDATITFTVSAGETTGETNSKYQYTSLQFEGSDKSDDKGTKTLVDLEDDLRVTVLFRNVVADVAGEKDVFLESDSSTAPLTENEDYKDVTENFSANSPLYGEASKSVNDENISKESERSAVMSGDTLTYRTRLSNNGKDDAYNVIVTDTIPEGCTYIDGSMRIYKQYKDITGITKYGSLELMASDSEKSDGYSVNYDEGKLTWEITPLELTYDYYVEFKVIVNDIGITNLSKTITNTMTWNYDYGSIKDGLQLTNNDDSYTLKFANTDSDSIKIKSVNFIPELLTELPTEISNATLTKYDNSDKKISETKVTLTYNNSSSDTTPYYSLSLDDLELGKGESFTLTVPVTKGKLTSDNKIAAEFSIVCNNEEIYAINNVEKKSNQVETDVTWLYLNISKEISTEDSNQSFLMKIDYYAKDDDKTPTSTFYTKVNCTTAITDENGNTVGYKGSQLVQCEQRGKYVVTECFDWSATDYDFSKTYYQDTASSKKQDINNNSVTISLSASTFANGAFSTEIGTNPLEKSPVVTFINDESLYAYISGQAYAENQFRCAS